MMRSGLHELFSTWEQAKSLGGLQGLPHRFVDEDQQVSHLAVPNYRDARRTHESSKRCELSVRKSSNQTQTIRPCSDLALRTYLKSVQSDHSSAKVSWATL